MRRTVPTFIAMLLFVLVLRQPVQAGGPLDGGTVLKAAGATVQGGLTDTSTAEDGWPDVLTDKTALAASDGIKDDEPPKDKDKGKDRDETEDEDADKAKAKNKDKDKDKDKAKAKDTKKDQKEKPSPVKKLVEIRIDSYLVAARAINIPLPGRVQTTREMLERLEKLAKDDEVGAILLDLDGVSLELADVEELRQGMEAFRKTGRKVMAYLNSGDPMGYLLACSADEIAIAPSGGMVIPGLGGVFPFMRGMYQLQGIEYDVITAGRFKYPGFVNQREPNKYFIEEYGALLDGMYDEYVQIIAEGRTLSKERVRKAIDQALFEPEDAKNHGLVDVLAYYDDYRDRILRREKFKKSREGESDWAKITSLQDLLTEVTKKMKEAQESYKAVGPKIAVLHARGPIVDADMGAGYASMIIMREQFAKSIEEIRKNKTIQAVVLRIDSPGGSAYASDVIWQKLRELDEQKPVVVSMGTVAGSGGYYIACPGRLIFAESTTITGSIGVIAILANQASRYNRMDVNLEEMKRGERALLGSGHRDMKPEDRELIVKMILTTYEQFLDRVAAGRKMPKDEVRKIAEGRIYTGRQAKEIGLVDRIGTLKDAVDAARDMANIPPSAEIKLVHYPRAASWGELAESLFGASAAANLMAQAQSPASNITFDSQVRYFGQAPKPLCWMAMPDFWGPTWGTPPVQPSIDLLDLLRGDPRRPALPELP